ncbi:MAG: hypothetical protein LBL96_01520, partial [Clostridiales bacterium]|nr:hypothetical protein [Clostridiales bacterium]
MRYKYIILTYIVIISFFMPAYIVSGSQTNTDENNPIDPGLYFITGSYGPLGDIDKTRHYINSDDYSIVTPLIPINYPYQNNPSSFIWDISKDSEGYYEIAPLDRNEYKVSFKYPYLEYGGRGVAVLGKDNESDAQKWIIKSTGLDWEGDLGPQFTISPKSYPEYKLLIENIRDSGLPANSTTNPLVAIPKHVYMGDSGSRWAFRNINTVLSSSSEISMSVQNSDLGVLLSL